MSARSRWKGTIMRLLVAINRVCYGSCLLAIIAGAFLAVYSIWTEHHDVGWKGVATAAVLIFAAVLVLATNAIIGSKVMEEGGGLSDLVPGTGGKPSAQSFPLAVPRTVPKREHAERKVSEEREGPDLSEHTPS